MFEIRTVQSAADVEYVDDKPVLHRWVQVTVRFQKGFNWSGPEVKKLLKGLQQAEELNDE